MLRGLPVYITVASYVLSDSLLSSSKCFDFIYRGISEKIPNIKRERILLMMDS